MEDSNLLFIVSQPRSGSTLLQSILSNNDYINSTSEPWILLPYLTILKPRFQKGIYDSNLARLGIEEFISKHHHNNALTELTQKLILQLYAPLLQNNCQYVLDKTPRYYEILPEIINCFPNSKVIILKRNPIDVLKSIIQTWNVSTLRALSAYARDILDAPSILETFYQENQENKNIVEVYYEDFIKNPLQEISGLFQWLQLPFHEIYLDFKKNQKIKGLMGDQVGVNKYETITSQESKAELSSESLANWGEFISGYQNFLNSLALTGYNRYQSDVSQSSVVFTDFYKAHKMGMYDRNQFNLDKLSFIFKYKLKSKRNLLYS